MQNEELAKELHKPNIRKFENRKVHSSFINNTDLVQFSVKVFPAFFFKSSIFPSNFSKIYIFFPAQKYRKRIKFQHTSTSILSPMKRLKYKFQLYLPLLI